MAGSGNVYVVDLVNRVQEFTGGGAFLISWGSLGSEPGQFEDPSGVAVDLNGNVYADRDNNRIQKFGDASPVEPSTWGQVKAR